MIASVHMRECLCKSMYMYVGMHVHIAYLEGLKVHAIKRQPVQIHVHVCGHACAHCLSRGLKSACHQTTA